ncbi:hypothetical protein EV690_1973 [Celerinatantimonas diazotrophica]|uniref:Uncharacterized protein n=1 Tax=Celerinatantimonas diazotrophica TaxID=412034 RepID=A0A4R1JLS5_9GAMM|nr:hypothetical protein EV690_1973 [Celerinatantimonas diazotrophica]CAG9296417.1 hypothetical protein CEDIAZO_01568 [Celerinatantimonas diazotrophica]
MSTNTKNSVQDAIRQITLTSIEVLLTMAVSDAK